MRFMVGAELILGSDYIDETPGIKSAVNAQYNGENGSYSWTISYSEDFVEIKLEAEMIKYAFLVAAIVVMSQAQRSPYAGSPNRQYPQVLPQYLPSMPNNNNPTTVIGERIGVVAADTNSPSTGYVAYDPYNDQALINRIKTWPKEKQPFWFINREAIKNHLGKIGSTRTSSTTV